MLLRQASTENGSQSNPDLAALALSAMEATCPALSLIQFRSIPGNASTDPKNAGINGAGEMRAIDSSFTAATTSVPEVTATLRIMGDEVKTDQAFERRFQASGTSGLTSERARALAKYSRSLGRYLTDQIINADGTGQTITGLKAMATGDQLLSMGTNGALVSHGSDNTAKKSQQFFLQMLEELLAQVPGAQALFMDSKLRARMKSIAREYVTVTQVQDAFGQNQELVQYNGLPIIVAGKKSDNSTLIIPHTETKGTSADCTSVYAAAFAEDDELAFVTSTGLSVKNKGLVGVHYVTSVEMDINTQLFADNAVGRLEGVRLD